MKLPRFTLALLPAALLGLAFAPAESRATIILSSGVNNAGTDNVLLANNQSGSTVVGQIGNSGPLVNFSSTTDTLLTQSSGQAKIFSQDGRVENISFALQSGDFTRAVFNAFGDGLKNIGPATLTVVANDGTFTFDATSSTPFTLGGGNNFYTVTALNGETISSVSISVSGTDAGFLDLRQIRLGTGIQTIPEPATLTSGLMAAGLAGLVVLRRRRNRTATPA